MSRKIKYTVQQTEFEHGAWQWRATARRTWSIMEPYSAFGETREEALEGALDALRSGEARKAYPKYKGLLED